MATWSLKKRQYAAYALFLLLTTVAVSLAYQVLNRDLVLFRRAENLFAKGDYHTAKAFYEQAILMGLHRSDAGINLLATYQAMDLQDIDPKIKDKIFELMDTPRALVSAIDWLGSQQNWSEALSLLMHQPEIWNSEPGIILRMADMYRNAGKQKEAEQYYRRALSLSPRSLYGRFRLAEALAWQKRYDEAETFFKSILSDHPNHRFAMIYLARILSWQERFKEAIKIYGQILGEST